MPVTQISRGRDVRLDRKSFWPWLSDIFQSSVIDDCWGQVLFFGLFSTMVACVDQLTDRNIAVNSAALGVLSGLLGFVVSLRTSSAYDRFCEGQKVWAQLFQHSRLFAQLVWIHVKVAPPPSSEEEVDPDSTVAEELATAEEDCQIRSILEKKTILNLVQAYAVALKHHCRSESGVFYDDLYPLVSFLPKYAFPQTAFATRCQPIPLWQASHSSGKKFVPTQTPTMSRQASEIALDRSGREASLASVETAIRFEKQTATGGRPYNLSRAATTVDLLPGRMAPRRTLSEHIPLLAWVRQAFCLLFLCRTTRQKPDDEEMVEWQARQDIQRLRNNIPLEIALFLSSYVASIEKRKLLEGPALASLFAAVAGLQDQLTTLERLLSTALPFAYKFHLHMTVYIFLLIFPFQIVDALGWMIIPATVLVAFFFLGFLVRLFTVCKILSLTRNQMIGAEIEDPFGFQKNDLDLDLYCALLSKEISEIISHPVCEPLDYVFDPLNTPFATSGDARSAHDILQSCNDEPNDRGAVLASIQESLTNHFHHASKHAAKSVMHKHRHAAKKAARKKVQVEAF